MLNNEKFGPSTDALYSDDLFAGISKDPVWARAANTRRAYESDWVAFTRWCGRQNEVALPAAASTVAAYIADRGELVNETGEYIYAATTLARWVSAINARHRRADLALPGASSLVSDILAGLRGRAGESRKRMAPLLLPDLKSALAHIDLQSFPRATIGYRDSAILVLGFVGAFRRSELAAKRIGDITLHAKEGLQIRLHTADADSERRGLVKRLPFGADPLTCPPCALLRWVRILDAAQNSAGGLTKGLLAELGTTVHICGGPTAELERLASTAWLFRPVRRGGHIGTDAISGHVVNDVVKRRLAAVGLDPRRFGSHSLRSGFITQAMLDGASSAEIQQQTGHRDPANVERYRRRQVLQSGNAVTRLQL
ncbi:integrase [Salinibacterium sp. ZJ454]|uniref:integrase n=1 Tax=Salinibacterium sp. ZJ454 TaxID=2708339 RepID=UPI001422F38E|nr:integrase [Salinibacterium sp. ZJ454]